MEAEIAKSALDNAGIESVVRADDAGGLRPDLQMRGVELLVRTDQAAAAGRVLSADVSL